MILRGRPAFLGAGAAVVGGGICLGFGIEVAGGAPNCTMGCTCFGCFRVVDSGCTMLSRVTSPGKL